MKQFEISLARGYRDTTAVIILSRGIYCFSKKSGFRMLRGCFYCKIRDAGFSVGSSPPRIFKRNREMKTESKMESILITVVSVKV